MAVGVPESPEMTLKEPELNIGEWRVDAASSQISRDGEVVRVDARVMRLLTCLAARAGEVVTTDELLAQVWGGVVVTQDSVYQAVASLRRVLGDDPKSPTYIATVPRRGYRLVARISHGTGAEAPAALGLAPAMSHAPAAPGPTVAMAQAPASVNPTAALASVPAGAQSPAAEPTRRWKLGMVLGVGAVLCLAQAASVDSGAGVPQKSVAVLPFLDLTTESMDQEFFADGLTEELIDDLSRTPGMKVPSATASFYFKGKQMTVANIARELGVAYVVDGSLRKADTTLRVAARLMRADNGFVIWSGTYDTQSDNVLKIQGDVAAQVTQALQAVLQGRPASTGGVR
jgi:TolB-like protein/DNA-binding winged helix-turn-helix (wHTH) protein